MGKAPGILSFVLRAALGEMEEIHARPEQSWSSHRLQAESNDAQSPRGHSAAGSPRFTTHVPWGPAHLFVSTLQKHTMMSIRDRARMSIEALEIGNILEIHINVII